MHCIIIISKFYQKCRSSLGKVIWGTYIDRYECFSWFVEKGVVKQKGPPFCFTTPFSEGWIWFGLRRFSFNITDKSSIKLIWQAEMVYIKLPKYIYIHNYIVWANQVFNFKQCWLWTAIDRQITRIDPTTGKKLTERVSKIKRFKINTCKLKLSI